VSFLDKYFDICYNFKFIIKVNRKDVKKMKQNQLEIITNLFEGNEIRSIWNSDKEEYYFSVVDVVSVLTENDYQRSRNYWKWLKYKLNDEGSELVSHTNQLKTKAKDGKMRNTDMLDTQNILRLIESIPSPKAEPFKMWLASLGNERINEILDKIRPYLENNGGSV